MHVKVLRTHCPSTQDPVYDYSGIAFQLLEAYCACNKPWCDNVSTAGHTKADSKGLSTQVETISDTSYMFRAEHACTTEM